MAEGKSTRFRIFPSENEIDDQKGGLNMKSRRKQDWRLWPNLCWTTFSLSGWLVACGCGLILMLAGTDAQTLGDVHQQKGSGGTPAQVVAAGTVSRSPSQRTRSDDKAGAEPDWLKLQQAVEAAIAKAEPSVVAVARVRRPSGRALGGPLDGFAEAFRPTISVNGPDFVPNEFGTGIVFRTKTKPAELLVLTNWHVVVSNSPPGPGVEDQILVRWAGGTYVEARIVAADRRSDLAVLRPNWKAAGPAAERVKPVKFGDASQLKKGSFVLVLGNPYMLARDGSASASLGIVSNFSRFPSAPRADTFPYAPYRDTLAHLGWLLHVDTRLEVGSSGGALIDLNGLLVGVTTSLAAIEGYEKATGFAIPLTRQTQRIIRSLERGMEPEYGFLGIEPLDGRLTAEGAREAARVGLGPLAVYLGGVLKDSPAAQAGLRAGDYILSVAGRPVRDKYELMREVGLEEPGAVVTVQVWRPSERRLLTLSVKLGKWPVYDERNLVVTRQRYPLWRGLRVDYPTARRRFLLGPQLHYPKAVVVTAVEKDSPAAKAGLHPGDFVAQINGVPVETPKHFYRVAGSLDGPVQLKLWQGKEVTILNKTVSEQQDGHGKGNNED